MGFDEEEEDPVEEGEEEEVELEGKRGGGRG